MFYQDRSPTPSPLGAPWCASIACQLLFDRAARPGGIPAVVEHRAGAVLRAGGPGAHRGSGRWAMSAGTESLIRAIKPTTRWRFMGGSTHSKDARPGRWRGRRPWHHCVGRRLLMYSKAVQSDPVLATRYAAMIEALMDAGANPLVQIGERFVVRRGHTEAGAATGGRRPNAGGGLGRFARPCRHGLDANGQANGPTPRFIGLTPPTPTSVATIKPWPELSRRLLAAERRGGDNGRVGHGFRRAPGAEPKTSAPLKPLAAWLLRE